MIGTKVYQICVSGRYKHFEQETKYMSHEVYLERPSQKVINEFKERCCNSEHVMTDIDPKTAVVRINELMVTSE